MKEIFQNPLFGIILCIFTYELGILLNKKLKTPIANPLLIGIVLCIVVLKIFNIPFASFNKGGSIISMFLAPATVALAVSIYTQYKLLKENLFPIIIGCAVGSLASMSSVYILCKLFRLDEKITYAMVPKSVTTPIAMAVSEQLGGVVPVTVSAVVLTGILGAIFAPTFIKLFRVKDSVAVGVAIGTCSHAAGTTKAMEIGDVEGAMSSIAIGIAGFMTVIFAMFI